VAANWYIIGALGAGAAGLAWWHFHQASSLSRADALQAWDMRRQAAGASLYACMYRYEAESKRHAQIAFATGAVFGVAALATGGGFGAVLKAAGTGAKLANKVQGQVAGCAAEAADAAAEWDWLISEAGRLGVAVDISDENLTWLLLSLEGGADKLYAKNQAERADRYQKARAQGLNDFEAQKVNMADAERGPMYRCERDYRKSTPGREVTACGWESPEYLRGEAELLSPTRPTASTGLNSSGDPLGSVYDDSATSPSRPTLVRNVGPVFLTKG